MTDRDQNFPNKWNVEKNDKKIAKNPFPPKKRLIKRQTHRQTDRQTDRQEKAMHSKDVTGKKQDK